MGEPVISGSVTLSKVKLSSLALLKIVQHGTRSLPELCAGSILGLDDNSGVLEVSNCFPYPSLSSGTGAGEEEEDILGYQNESDVSEFREDMLKLLRDCNTDDFCVGWYRTVNMGDWCDLSLVEQQFEHQDECDQGTGKAKSVLIVYDPFQTENGVLSLKALRLTDAFMEIMRVRNSSDPKVAQASDIALSKTRINDVFYEIPIELDDGGTLASMALSNLRVGLGEDRADDLQDVAFDRLVLCTEPYLEKNVAFAIEEMEALKEEQQSGNAYQKQVARQKMQQDRWIATRKQENAARAERGEEPLPLYDYNQPFFKVLKDSSKLGSLLVRKQIDIYCEQINDWSAQSLERLFLVGAAQQQYNPQPNTPGS